MARRVRVSPTAFHVAQPVTVGSHHRRTNRSVVTDPRGNSDRGGTGDPQAASPRRRVSAALQVRSNGPRARCRHRGVSGRYHQMGRRPVGCRPMGIVRLKDRSPTQQSTLQASLCRHRRDVRPARSPLRRPARRDGHRHSVTSIHWAGRPAGQSDAHGSSAAIAASHSATSSARRVAAATSCCSNALTASSTTACSCALYPRNSARARPRT